MGDILYRLDMDLDPGKLVRYARLSGVQTWNVADLGCFVHTALAALYKGTHPTPFWVRNYQPADPVRLSLYADEGVDAFLDRLDACRGSNPVLAHTFRVATLKGRSYDRRRWRKGLRLPFTVDFAAVETRTGSKKEQCIWATDWFDGIPEEAVSAWVRRRLNPRDRGGLDTHDPGCTVLGVETLAYGTRRTVRKTAGNGHGVGPKQRVGLRLPFAVARGVLEVVDGDLFHATIRAGIGKHRAFGSGFVALQVP